MSNEAVLQFLFIVAVPFVIVAGGALSLFAVGALFDALDHPDQLQQRIEALFRRPPREPRHTSHSHYYRPYWS